MGWELLDDETVLKRLEVEGAREEAESCKRAGESHWYLNRLDLGKVIDGALMIMVGTVENIMKDIEGS